MSPAYPTPPPSLSPTLSHNLLGFLVLQEQLRRRREEEERIAQQNEFLRNSLRGSRKLKALQDTTAASVSASATPLGSSSAGGAGGAGGGAKAQQQTAAAMVLGVENEAYLPDEDVAPQVEHIDGEFAGQTRPGRVSILPTSSLPSPLFHLQAMVSLLPH